MPSNRIYVEALSIATGDLATEIPCYLVLRNSASNKVIELQIAVHSDSHQLTEFLHPLNVSSVLHYRDEDQNQGETPPSTDAALNLLHSVETSRMDVPTEEVHEVITADSSMFTDEKPLVLAVCPPEQAESVAHAGRKVRVRQG